METVSGTIEVRTANDDRDVAVLADLRAAWVQERHGVSADSEFVDRFAAWSQRQSRSRRAWLVLVDGDTVGMANLLIYERMPSPARGPMFWGYVGAVFVRPEHRYAGVGRALMNELIAWSTENGLERLVLNPSDRSIPFYERLGFDRPPKLRQLDLPPSRP